MSTASTVISTTTRISRRWLVVALLALVAVAGATATIIALTSNSSSSKPATQVQVLPAGPMYMGGHADRRPPQATPDDSAIVPSQQTPGARP